MKARIKDAHGREVIAEITYIDPTDFEVGECIYAETGIELTENEAMALYSDQTAWVGLSQACIDAEIDRAEYYRPDYDLAYEAYTGK